MERVFAQVRCAVMMFECPLLIAGDLFDKWNPSSRLISFAMDMLPNWDEGWSHSGVFTVAGQHDLPMHSLEYLDRSGYGVLMKAGRITHLSPDSCYCTKHMNIFGASWGQMFCPSLKTRRWNIGLIHKHLWYSSKTKHIGAPEEGNVSKQELHDLDCVISGDNHKEFCVEKNETLVYNCGPLMRRKSDEADIRPRIGLLVEDGYGGLEVRSVRLDTSKDCHLTGDAEKVSEVTIDFDRLDKVLKASGSMDFALQVEAVVRELDNEDVRRILTEALNAGQAKV
jgi:DNA repair exonuclease SbcCD nuclease subunit